VVAANQRDRIVAATIAVVARRGYQDAPITALAAEAGVSRRTFYDLFAGREECLAYAYGVVAAHLRERAAAAAEGARGWPARVRARVGAVLAAFAANPDLVGFCLIAPARAGAPVARRFDAALEEALGELTAGMPRRAARRRLSPAAEPGVLGAAVALVAAKVEAGEGAGLAALEPELSALLLAPWLGREEAARAAGLGAAQPASRAAVRRRPR
jgi:AcrR family transcriptional regulator